MSNLITYWLTSKLTKLRWFIKEISSSNQIIKRDLKSFWLTWKRMKLPVNRSSVLSYLQLQLVLNWDNLLWSSWRPGILGANLLIPREEIWISKLPEVTWQGCKAIKNSTKLWVKSIPLNKPNLRQFIYISSV